MASQITKGGMRHVISSRSTCGNAMSPDIDKCVSLPAAAPPYLSLPPPSSFFPLSSNHVPFTCFFPLDLRGHTQTRLCSAWRDDTLRTFLIIWPAICHARTFDCFPRAARIYRNAEELYHETRDSVVYCGILDGVFFVVM